MNINSSQDFKLPEDYDIEEVTLSSKEDKVVVKAGKVEAWERSHTDENSKARLYLTSTIMAIWAIWLLAGLIRYVFFGDIFLINSSPTLLVVFLLKSYFKKD